MAKKQKQPTKTCADCIHESACRIWTDGRRISDASASVCPNHETVKESGAYLCGVLDERRRNWTNGDNLRAMSNKELAEWIHSGISSDACDYCEYNDGFCDGTPCRGKAEVEVISEWLRQPAEGD